MAEKNHTDINLAIGSEVSYRGKKFIIKAPIDLNKVLLQDYLTNVFVVVPIVDLLSLDNNQEDLLSVNKDLISISKEVWDEIVKRQTVLDPLARQKNCNKKGFELFIRLQNYAILEQVSTCNDLFRNNLTIYKISSALNIKLILAGL